MDKEQYKSMKRSRIEKEGQRTGFRSISRDSNIDEEFYELPSSNQLEENDYTDQCFTEDSVGMLSDGEDGEDLGEMLKKSSISITNKRQKIVDSNLESKVLEYNVKESAILVNYVKIKVLDGSFKMIPFQEDTISVRVVKQQLEEMMGYNPSYFKLLNGKTFLTDDDHVENKTRLFMITQFYG